MNMIDGRLLRDLEQARIRAAPRPANISTNELADWLKNWAPDSCRDRLRQHRLAGPGRPVQEDALRHAGSQLLEAVRVAQELHHLAQLMLGLVAPGDVFPADRGRPLRLDRLRLVRGIDFSVRQIR